MPVKHIGTLQRTVVVNGKLSLSQRPFRKIPAESQRLASAGALGPAFGVSPQLITFTCQLSLR